MSFGDVSNFMPESWDDLGFHMDLEDISGSLNNDHTLAYVHRIRCPTDI